jgi:hypothetical protein
MNVGDFRHLHLATLSDRQREKYDEVIEKSREEAELIEQVARRGSH